ncbi:MAG: hypothetical protein HRU17_22280 [Polyangiaceae bacterium]|nr:hypothetical protein [Polyangiaceae bacterium]
MCSSLAERVQRATLYALHAGAGDFIAKPKGRDFTRMSKELVFKVRAAARAKVRLPSGKKAPHSAR